MFNNILQVQYEIYYEDDANFNHKLVSSVHISLTCNDKVRNVVITLSNCLN